MAFPGKKLLWSCLFFLGMLPAVHAQVPKSTINAEISSSTAASLLGGTILNNITASYVDWLTCTGTGGLLYWNAGIPSCLTIGTSGQSLVVSGGLPVWVSAFVSPTFTGIPTAPTAAIGTNTAQIATTAFVANISSITNIKSQGAACNGAVDDTAAVAAAIAAVPYGGALYIPAGSTCLVTGSGSAIFTRTTPITIYGDGPSFSQIVMNTSVPNTRDLFHFAPTAAGAGYHLSSFGIVGKSGGTYGRHAIYIDTSASGSSAYNFFIDHMLIAPTLGGNSINVTNTQSSGGVFYSAFELNNLDSISLNNVGDGILLRNNTLNSTVNPGIYAYNVTGAGGLQIYGNEISSPAGHIIIDGGVAPIIFGNELEINMTDSYGYMLDILGSVSSVWAPQLLNNQIQALAGANNPVPVRIAAATNASLSGGRISVITGNHIDITAAAANTVIGQTTQYVTNNVIGALSLSNSGTATSNGVSCSGISTVSFASINGTVTHC